MSDCTRVSGVLAERPGELVRRGVVRGVTLRERRRSADLSEASFRDVEGMDGENVLRPALCRISFSADFCSLVCKRDAVEPA